MHKRLSFCSLRLRLCSASGSRIRIVVDSEGGTISFISEAEGSGTEADFTFISAIGMYELTMMDSCYEGQGTDSLGNFVNIADYAEI